MQYDLNFVRDFPALCRLGLARMLDLLAIFVSTGRWNSLESLQALDQLVDLSELKRKP